MTTRKSGRVMGEEPEFGEGLPPVHRRRRKKPTNSEEGSPEATQNPEDILSIIGSGISSKSKKSSVSATSRRKLKAELDALEKIDELDTQLEAIEIMRRDRIERKKILVAKQLELQKAAIDEELSSWDDDNSQNLSGEEPEGDNHQSSVNARSEAEEVKILSFRPELETQKKVEKWLEDEKPPTPQVQNSTKVNENKTEESNMKIYLARQTVAKDLPLFSGDPVEWPKFIAHYRSSTAACGFSNVENMARLEKSLRGKAKEAVQCMMAIPDKVEAVIARLEKNFGRPDLIIKILTEKAERMSHVRDEKPEALMEFANAVVNLTSTAEVLKKKEYLANPFLMEKLIDKLSPGMKRDWGSKLKNLSDGAVKLEEFSAWITTVAEEVAEVSTSHYSSCGQEDKKEKHQRGRDGRRGAMVAAVENKNGDCCALCNKFGHDVTTCWDFAKMTIDDRWNWITVMKLCFCCLIGKHRTSECPDQKVCGKDSCEMIHHLLLHFKKKGKPKFVAKQEKQGEQVTHTVEDCADVPLCVLPVIVTGPNGEIQTYAVLDSVATVTLIDAEIATQIGLSGKKRPLKMQWIDAKTNTEVESMQVRVKIRGPHSKQSFSADNFQTVNRLALPYESVNVKKLKSSWQHLRKVPLPKLENVQPKILIGLNNAKLIVPLEVCEGPGNAPIAVKTRLGWALYGKSRDYRGRVDESFVCSIFKTPDDQLHQLVKDSFRIEELGVKISEDNLLSREDKRTKELTELTTRRVDGGWETGLLWKEDDIILPESKTMALNRLYSMERKMDKNSVFAEQYCGKINEYLEKGFVHKLTAEELSKPNPRTWYLPYFAVYNPNKPKKIRLVFDAAAKSRGVSLNDKLLKGLDLLKPLPAVLCKFRQRKIGFGADIRDMFHRVKIREEDLPAQRFLWRGMDRKSLPDTYVMDVMIFGAVSSPYSAQEVKNRNVLTLEPPASENAVSAIVDRHYMDDYLDSCSSENEARNLILEVVNVHKQGGFEICNWICSDPKILEVLPENLRAAGKEVISLEGENATGEAPTERVLGLHWDPVKDVFVFTTKLKKIDEDLVNGMKKPTKREALSVVMSVFDPLGFLTHLTIKAKILLQDVWRSEIGWDEMLTEEPQEKWERWLRELQDIGKFQVPRCYYPKINSETEISLHVFCDASEQAFAAVAYLRMKNEDDVQTGFVMAKSRVAPLRPESIPRLELQGALLGSRMAATICEYHEIKISEIHFWTDSKTVLCWLRSDGRRFKPFVAHRIGEILENTDLKNWHWVPTKENVADEATRDGRPADIGPGSRWLRGPDFLRKRENEWPMELPLAVLKEDVDEKDLEKKKDFVASITFAQDGLPDIRRFSSFLRLIRSTAWMLRFISRSRIKSRGARLNAKRNQLEELSVQEMNEAETLWLKKVQSESFGDEISLLKNGNPIPRASRLRRLVPDLNEQGLLVVKGRISHAAQFGAPTNYPIILDPKNEYTKLLLQHAHSAAGHHGTEKILNEVRQKYWILDARAALKRTLKNCQMCKVRKVVPMEPEMGQLPAFRVNRQPRPFTFTGLDYFGSMDVTIGRRHEKRYGALFTCLTTRAVHLEIAGSLTTDSCIMAIRRFMARRGAPQQIWSDNGTNFHGANNELKKALDELNQNQIVSEMAIKGVDWKFIPPSGPQMGGTWERLVRSVKTALSAVLNTRSPKEEVLQTLMAEAEYSVNSRPLTHVSNDPDDGESLTPNHFLLGGPGGVQNVGNFSDWDLFTRKEWRLAQKLADIFWQRWVKEYLPTLTRRTKDSGEKKTVKLGDLVFIADGDMKRNCWPRGVVVKLFLGKDGVVRVVEVKTNQGLFRRPVFKVCVIDVDQNVDVP